MTLSNQVLGPPESLRGPLSVVRRLHERKVDLRRENGPLGELAQLLSELQPSMARKENYDLGVRLWRGLSLPEKTRVNRPHEDSPN